MSNLYCAAVTKDGNNCSRKALTGETMCRQHLHTNARTLERNMKRKVDQERYDALRKKWAEENAKKAEENAIKRGTEEQRAKFKADVLAAWNASKPLLTEDENAYDGYNSDLEIEEDGVGVCSTCGKTNYCVKVNHGQVFCTDNSQCFYPRYNWFYNTPADYPLEIEEYLNKLRVEEVEKHTPICDDVRKYIIAQYL